MARFWLFSCVLWTIGMPALAQSVSFRESVSGAVSAFDEVTTDTAIVIGPGDYYVTALSTRPFEPALSVEGLGLSWAPVVTQCSARGQGGIEIWTARVDPDASPGEVDSVSARFGASLTHGLIAVARYSGVAAAIPEAISGNTLGPSGGCEGGLDNAFYELAFGSSRTGSRVVSVVSHRHRDHEPGLGYQELESLEQGSGGTTVSLSIQDRLYVETAPIVVDGSFSGDVDWALGALHLLPDRDGFLEMWMDHEAILSRPMFGDAWEEVLEAADGDLGLPNLSDFNSDHDVLTLAVALVYARTRIDVYREKAARAIMSAIGTEDGTTQVVQIGRNLVCYIIAADMIGLSVYEPSSDAVFREWIDEIRFVVWPDGSLVDEDEERANNHGRMAGASRAAIAIYLGDGAELVRTAQVFRGFMGDRESYDDFEWRFDLSWQEDELQPVGINASGAEKDGVSIDGALPEEMRRGCPFQDPPCYTNYPWEGLQGAYVEAALLSRAGHEMFDVEDRALLRAVTYLDELRRRFPDETWWAVGDDSWIPWLVNAIYDTDFPTERARLGKCMAWTDWTHGAGATDFGVRRSRR